MKKSFCLIVLLFSLSCYGSDKEFQKNDNYERYYDYQRNGYLEKNESRRYYGHQKYENYDDDDEYIGNPDFDAEIERPCRVYDLNCIRKFFAEHSKCKIRRGPLPRNLDIDLENLYYSFVNSTVTSTEFTVGGFRKARVEEFYINRRTNKVVFSIQIQGFTKTFPTVYFVIYRNRREPIIPLTESMDFFYQSVTYTAVIPNIDDLRLDKAEITGYADSALSFVLSPDYLNDPEPVVIQTLVEFLADLPTATQEIIFTDSYLFVPAYIQFNICDFGLNNL